MAKIFCGGSVYKVGNTSEAYEVMNKIASACRGTFGGCPCAETGFYVDPSDTINLGKGKKLYRIKGTSNGKYYAETDSKDLFKGE